ncbi:MAG: phenylalanine--tRNA ligase subunit beta, partial [Thermoleophilia bacterium]|nr:phenylalanine--tRNA ligase subunit beta [Thermoleophilia bacterium]
GTDRVALFESGRAYLPERAPTGAAPLRGGFAGSRPAPVAEPHRIAAVLAGVGGRAGWRADDRPVDFYDAKGIVELVAAALGVDVGFAPTRRAFLHPARAAAVRVGGSGAGWVGELHPQLLERIGARSGAALELDLEPLLAGSAAGEEIYEDVTTHPAVAEDIAVVGDADLDAGTIRAAVLEAGGELLESAEVFDVYAGEQVPAGKRSLALRLAFRAPDRTLTDAEVEPLRARIVAALEATGARLRG